MTDSPPPPVRSVYVHAPFCVRRCVYCDFAVTVSPEGNVAGWAEALAAEMRWVEGEEGSLPDQLETLYVGGGTPSLLGPDAMRALADVIGADRLRSPSLEWSSEANPESFTPPVAAAWRGAGLNRVSLGVQSFHEPTLRWMGRLHGAAGAGAAVEAGRAEGFDNLSVDLLFALPSHVGRSWRDDLDRVLALDVPHVSLYGLGVEPGTPLGRAVREGREPSVDEERYREEYLHAADLLVRAGYRHYEVSNFARPGFESRHNLAYWDGRPYLGLGNGAHSYRHPVRRWNVRDWAAYRAKVLAGGAPVEGSEALDEAATTLERIWLSLRTARGLAADDLSAGELALADRWRTRGLAVAEGGRVRLTAEGWLVLDRLAVEMDAVGSL